MNDSTGDHEIFRIVQSMNEESSSEIRYGILADVNKIISDYYCELPLEQAVILLELSERIDDHFCREVEQSN